MADYPYIREQLPDGQWAIEYPGRNGEATEEYPDGVPSHLALEAASWLPAYAIGMRAAGGACVMTADPPLTVPDEATLDQVVADHQANTNPGGIIDDASGYLLTWGYGAFVAGAGQTVMANIPRPAYALGEYGATLLSRWTGAAWEYVAQPAYNAFIFHVAARLNDVGGVVTADQAWEALGGAVSHPQFFIPDLTKALGVIDLEIKTSGATAELRIEEQTDGGDNIVAAATLPDTAGVWTRFQLSSAGTPPAAGKNTYELQGRLNGAASLEVRYATLSLLEIKS